MEPEIALNNLDTLISMGYSRDESHAALLISNDDLAAAIEFLVSESSQSSMQLDSSRSEPSHQPGDKDGEGRHVGRSKKNHSRHAKPHPGMVTVVGAKKGIRVPAPRERRGPGPEPPCSVPEEEQRQIDSWIRVNRFNFVGDPKGAMYAGGSPLFDERTASRRNRYDYIVQRHPDKPWNDQT